MTDETQSPNRSEERLEVTYVDDVDRLMAASARDSYDDTRMIYAPLPLFAILASIPGFVVLWKHEQTVSMLVLALVLAAYLLAKFVEGLVIRSNLAALLPSFQRTMTVGITPGGFDLREGDFWGQASWSRVIELVETGYSIQFRQGSLEWVAPREETLEVPHSAFACHDDYQRFVDHARRWCNAWKESGAAPNSGDPATWPPEIRAALDGMPWQFVYRHSTEDAQRLDSLGENPTHPTSSIAMAFLFLAVAVLFISKGLTNTGWQENDWSAFAGGTGHISAIFISTFLTIYFVWLAMRPKTTALANPIVHVALTPKALLVWHDWESVYIPAATFPLVSFVGEFFVMKNHDGRVRLVIPWSAIGNEEETQKFVDDYCEANLEAIAARSKRKDDPAASKNPYHPPHSD